MSTWIDEEVKIIVQEREAMQSAQETEYIIQTQSGIFWDSVRYNSEANLKEINKKRAFQGDPRGELRFAERNVWCFEILRGPNVQLRVERAEDGIVITRRVEGNGLGKPEQLQFVLDERRKLCVEHADGYFLAQEQMPKFLLKPLLR